MRCVTLTDYGGRHLPLALTRLIGSDLSSDLDLSKNSMVADSIGATKAGRS